MEEIQGIENLADMSVLVYVISHEIYVGKIKQFEMQKGNGQNG
ncbi:hypothetical protein [Abyssisolibacter fermentans]|nr:hypothetical protein [Abyssisolibacter fermentans]